MTQQEILQRLAAGDRTVKSKVPVQNATSLTGTVQQILFFGKHIKLIVQYPGNKFDVAYEENEDVDYRYVHYLKELE